MAADLYPKTVTPVYASPMPIISWAGFYIGAHGGWAASDLSYPGVPDYTHGGPADPSVHNGALVGAQAGYNWQVSNFVFGIVTDFSWISGMKNTVSDGGPLSENKSINWVGTVRGRAGYTINGFLPYVTAGLAYDAAKAGESCPSGVQFGYCNKHGAFSVSDTKTSTGFVWGGGIEYLLNKNWSISAEYLHADMGKQVYTLGAPNDLQMWPVQHDFTSVTGGINYRF